MQERRRRENSAQGLRCNSEKLKVLVLRERRLLNRESIAEVIKHQSTPEVDSEASSREELKRRALEELRMRERDRRNLADASLMHTVHTEVTRKSLTWVRAEPKIIVHPTVAARSYTAAQHDR
jgi:hypothetical protein